LQTAKKREDACNRAHPARAEFSGDALVRPNWGTGLPPARSPAENRP